ncbi:hypothetical protein ACP4OV_002144 [Aristida adscensionis]
MAVEEEELHLPMIRAELPTPPLSPSIYLNIPPTPHDDDGGVPSPSVEQQQEEDAALEHISRMLMEDDDAFLCQHRHNQLALRQAEESLADIISSSSSSLSSGGATNNAGTRRNSELRCSMDMLAMAFFRGMEEASKFLPGANSLVISPQADGTLGGGVNGVRLITNGSHGGQEMDAEAELSRPSKMMARAEPEEEAVVQEMIAGMMLSDCEMSREETEELRAAMEAEADWSSTREARRRRLPVDLRMLLVHCAEAVTDGRGGARELLAQIRRHASPAGDATQRVAHCFANALEARLAGAGSQVHRSLVERRRASVVDFLRAYRLFSSTCCFKKVAFMFANRSIYRVTAGRRRLHIIDYGIGFGFQWPSLLRWLAARDGGPPEVRITGIDVPLPGFRPALHMEETGSRLSCLAGELGVPLTFRAIAEANWDAVHVEDLGIDPGEVVVVNSLFRLETLADDTVVVDSSNPRDTVLGTVRRMRPAVFTHGIRNSFAGNSFRTRFREALFYYSSVFDALDRTLPRGSEQRQVLERDVLGPCVLNIVACEGRDWTDRIETYKQWQQRTRRAGLRQLPLDREVVGAVRDMVRQRRYHRDFVVDEDQRWLLQGWKGRILFAHSTWVADHTSAP